MATENEQVPSNTGNGIREFVDNHRLVTYYLVFEAFLIVSAYYLDTWTSFTVGPDGPDLSDIAAGLLGGWAVIFGLIGLIGIVLLVVSRLLQYGRSR